MGIKKNEAPNVFLRKEAKLPETSVLQERQKGFFGNFGWRTKSEPECGDGSRFNRCVVAAVGIRDQLFRGII